MSVSWLIPVRNGAAWLGAAVDSALLECGPGDEVVVVDDGSKDDPRSAVGRDSRIVWAMQPPMGIAAALEHGRSLCRGEFIARLDADDLAIPGRIDKQLALMRADTRIAVIGGQADLFCDGGEVPGGMRNYVDWVNGLRDLHAEILVESPLFHPAVLMRASSIDAVGGYREGDLPEDYDLWLRLDSAGYRLGAVASKVVRIRDRPERLTRTDPRYRIEAFDTVKLEWLRKGPLQCAPRLAVWGAGRTGKRWIRSLLQGGHRVDYVFDIHCRTERQGIAVLGPEGLVDSDFDVLLVAVGARGARQKIRATIRSYRPDLVEGRDWWALA